VHETKMRIRGGGAGVGMYVAVDE